MNAKRTHRGSVRMSEKRRTWLRGWDVKVLRNVKVLIYTNISIYRHIIKGVIVVHLCADTNRALSRS